MGALRRASPRPRRRSLSPLTASADDRAWPVLERRATPAVLHGDPPDPHDRRLACVCVPVGPAVVIGSGQSDSDFDDERLRAAGLDLVRRRSGGGAVLVAPGCQVWLDVFVPNGDVLAETDIGRSFYWLGQAFADAIAKVLGLPADQAEVEVHRGAAQKTPWSKVLCYAGLGSGEVTVGGRKVVGMSQRRSRSGAWIHSMALLGERGGDLANLLSGTAQDRAEAHGALRDVGLVHGEPFLDSLTEELLTRLP